MLEGIRHGFRLSDENHSTADVEVRNHRSAMEHIDQLERELPDQVAQVNYMLASSKSSIVSPLATIPKDGEDVRLIHDASRPMGTAMKDYCSGM